MPSAKGGGEVKQDFRLQGGKLPKFLCVAKYVSFKNFFAASPLLFHSLGEPKIVFSAWRGRMKAFKIE